MTEIAGAEARPADRPDAPSAEFAAFYRDQYPRAVRLAWLLTNRGADSEDLVQDAFARLGPRFATLDRPAAYLRTSIVNGTREAHRRRSREQRRLERVGRPADDLGEITPSDSHLLGLVAALPHPQRTVLVLRYWADLPDDDIAEILGVRPATVRSMVHRATRRLHKELTP
jgi:RNA polymerase sigma factor (sigma-70 family)